MNKKSQKERAHALFARGTVLVMMGTVLCMIWSMWWMPLTASGLGMMAWALWIEEH